MDKWKKKDKWAMVYMANCTEFGNIFVKIFGIISAINDSQYFLFFIFYRKYA
jgi:hypothetical protein